MTCDELLKVLNDYVDDESIAAVCHDFADHLAGCNPCQVVVDNIRKSIQLYRAGEPYPMPQEFHDRLRSALLAKWRAKFPNAQV